MSTNVWICDKCGGKHETKEKADACEVQHEEQFKKLTLKSAGWSKLDGLYGSQRGMAMVVPSSVLIRFGEHRSEFAIYTLSRVGPKGV